MDTILVRDLMTPDVIGIKPDTPLSEALHAMLDERDSCRIIVEHGQPVGIITERDVVHLMTEFLNEGARHAILVSDVMTTPVTTVTGETSLFEALVISTAEGIRHLPVVDQQGRMFGLVTQADLAKASFNLIEEQSARVETISNCTSCDIHSINEELRLLSLTDMLMGIGNRRAMEVDLEHTHDLARRYKRSYAVVLFDIDHFKRYNDTHGHLEGDGALRQMADYLKSCIRKADRLYRYGGEEILMLLPETSGHGAQVLADRILEGLTDMRLPHPSSPFGIITMSAGIAGQSDLHSFPTWQHVVQLADYALYSAKKAGRNCSRLTEEPVKA